MKGEVNVNIVYDVRRTDPFCRMSSKTCSLPSWSRHRGRCRRMLGGVVFKRQGTETEYAMCLPRNYTC